MKCELRLLIEVSNLLTNNAIENRLKFNYAFLQKQKNLQLSIDEGVNNLKFK